ncbi:MAG: hypothetical protein R6X02_13410 [Enhygromyxa sp.]
MSFSLLACGPGSVGGSGETSDGASGSLDDSSGSESDPGETDTEDPDPTGSWLIPDYPCGGEFRCTPTACDLFAQDCPYGEKCAPFASFGEVWDATKCVFVLGDLGPGEPCTYDGRVEATDDCDASSMCYDGICRPFCTGTPDNPSCPSELGCTAASPNDPLSLCLEPCDPLAQGCATGSCYSHSGQFPCNPTGDLEVGEPCGCFNDCSPGSACVDASALPSCSGTTCCSPLCNLEQPDCASLPGTECVAWFKPGQAPSGLELVGVCLSP